MVLTVFVPQTTETHRYLDTLLTTVSSTIVVLSTFAETRLTAVSVIIAKTASINATISKRNPKSTHMSETRAIKHAEIAAAASEQNKHAIFDAELVILALFKQGTVF